MPRPQKKPVKTEARQMPPMTGQKWRDTRFRDGERIAEITQLEDRVAVLRVVDTVKGVAGKPRTERVPASVFGPGSTWKLVE